MGDVAGEGKGDKTKVVVSQIFFARVSPHFEDGEGSENTITNFGGSKQGRWVGELSRHAHPRETALEEGVGPRTTKLVEGAEPRTTKRGKGPTAFRRRCQSWRRSQ